MPKEWQKEFFDYCYKVLDFVGPGDDGSQDVMYARNEASRRYVTMEPEFYIPEIWRGAPENKKQGSAGPVGEVYGIELNILLKDVIAHSLNCYNTALTYGVCAEQARLFLPMYGLYTVWRLTQSVQSFCHFLKQRHPALSHDAQVELQRYASAAGELVLPIFPHSVSKLSGLSTEIKGES